MKVNLKVNEKLEVQVEGDTLFSVFEALASAQQVFSVTKCGCCGSDNLKFVVRKASQGKKESGNKKGATNCRALSFQRTVRPGDETDSRYMPFSMDDMTSRMISPAPNA